LVGEQDSVLLASKIEAWRATLTTVEQLLALASFDGATFFISEQLCLRRSNFLHQRATLPSTEQVSSSASNSAFDGATFFISEQL